MNPVIQRVFQWVVDRPKSVIAIALVIVMAFASGLANLQISNDFRVYLGKENPQLKAFEAFEANYVKTDTATFVISAKKGDLFTREGLALIESITEEAWFIEHAERVSSLTNYPYTLATGDDIETNHLVENAADLSDKSLADIRQIALNEKRLVQRLMTADGKLGLVLVTLNLPKDQVNASIVTTERVEKIRNRYRNDYPEFQIDVGGSTTFNTTLARAVANDLMTLAPLSYLIIFSGLFVLLRSFFGACAIFALISVCLISTFGFFGWVAPVLTPIAGFVPSVLLAIMVADSVHILVTYFHQLHEGNEKKQAILESLKINFMPVLITSLTTMIGFLSLNFSVSPPYQDLGNMVAFGVLLALIFSLFLLPALMILLPVGRAARKPDRILLQPLAEFVVGNHKKLLLITSIVTVALIAFIPNNRLSDNWANYFDESFEVVRLVKRVDGYLTGINSLEYSLSSDEAGGIFNPDFLQQMDELELWLSTQNKVVTVTSLSQLMKELNQLMHGDQPDWYRVPKSSDLAAQYLLFYELGLPQGLGLNNLVTIHKDATRFSVSITDSGSDELLQMDRKVQDWIKQNAPAIIATPATGLGVVFAHIADRNIHSLLQGTLIALFGISIILMLIFKSVKYGLISLVPNVIPAAMAYGVWGLTVGYVDISLSIVACVTLGIVVDDTVHFLHKYILARKSGMSTADSVRDSFRRVGVALLTTSVVLASGFMILAVSHMNTSATIGVLMATTLIIALLVDFLLLPPLLLMLDKQAAQEIET